MNRILRTRWVGVAGTALIFVVILRRVPFAPLGVALAEADYVRFLAVMIPNTVFYFLWDTLVLATALGWFHVPVRYRDLLPVRAASYVVAFFNTNAGRGALALYLTRRLGAPFLQLGSTVIFLVFTEYLHLVAWATVGIVAVGSNVAPELVWVPPGVAVVWLAVFVYMRAAGPSPGLRSRNPRVRASTSSAPSEPAVPRPSAGSGRSEPAEGRPARDDPELRRRAERMLLAPREWALFRTFRLAPARRYAQIVLLRAPMFAVSLGLHYAAARAFGLEIPFWPLVAFLPVVFMLAALPITIAHLGTTQAAWIFFLGAYGSPARLLAFSLAAHLTFMVTRALIGVALLPWAYSDLVRSREAPA